MSQISWQLGLLSTLIYVSVSLAAPSLHAQTCDRRLALADLTQKAPIVNGPVGKTQRHDIHLASRAVAALRQLQAKVIVYRSLQDFESVTPSETFFIATAPYTVAIHWRQAAKFLLRAETLVKR